MSRPALIQDETILAAARTVFLRHGYAAPSALIARQAGVSEGLLFKRFRTKHALFLAALQSESGDSPWVERLMLSVGSGNIRKNLEFAGRHLLRRHLLLLPRIMMIRSSGITFKNPSLHGTPPPPVEHMRRLAAYFRAEIKCGRLVMKKPDTQAQAFVGALAHYAFCQHIFGYRSGPPDVYVREIVNGLVNAATPTLPARSPKTP
jgi:AcrR family transcriptional regulator